MPRTPGAAVTARAPAKVNLLLEVGPRRDDGYHDLVTVFQALALAEDVTAERAAPGHGTTVRVRPRPGVDASAVPLDGTNLAVRAARLLAERTGVPDDVHLTIDKAVPVAGGMAGGSADAAAALVACDALWQTRLGLTALTELGAQLGSDVPFALHGRTAVGTGRGEQLAPVMTTARFSWVFVLAGDGLSTPAVYAELDRLRADRPGRLEEPRLDAVERALRSGDPLALGAALDNDLQEAALSLAPQLVATLEAGRAAGAAGAVVSGSGPTVALLATSPAHARELAAELGRDRPEGAVLVADAPAPGARVLEAVRAGGE
ncbi:4-(cytidine 5'-diphospho)-2-C-methyl-D-erythritol kinase [Kineococcus terrestris]|uniref:4-(cytidine 5'-diphospho)-2-C-methyl-D-erythritol kinase n=1 Tax=Kineococcus terrestris TaxID=2044856 RepID=UPI0034DB6592